MKKVTVILASLAIFATISCKDNQEEATVVEKETVIIEQEPEKIKFSFFLSVFTFV